MIQTLFEDTNEVIEKINKYAPIAKKNAKKSWSIMGANVLESTINEKIIMKIETPKKIPAVDFFIKILTNLGF